MSTTFLSHAGWQASDSTNSTGGDIAANAIDGNTSTRWASDQDQTNGQYFQVDLGQVQNFNTVSMDAGSSVNDYPRGYAIYVSNNNVDWATDAPVATGAGSSAQVVSTFGLQSARYVRIVQTGSSPSWWWSLAELNIGVTQTASGATPTAQEQYALELLNRARANPAGEAALDANSQYVQWEGTPDLNEGLPAGTISNTAKQPLAFDPYLEASAQAHSTWMLSNGLSHTEPDAAHADPTARGITAGYIFPANTLAYIGENISDASGYTTDQTTNADIMEQELFIDPGTDASVVGAGSARGHRLQLLNGLSNLAGVGIVNSPDGATSYETQDFTANHNTYLTGVCFNDTAGTNFYAIGEGLGGVTITATNLATNQSFTTTTWAAGGYTLQLVPGAYTVTASGGGIGTPATQTVTLTSQNVESDFLETTTVAPPPAASAPTILVQPTAQSDNFHGGAIGQNVTFSVSATGTPAPTIQWQVSSGGGAFTDIAGATSGAYTFTPTTAQNGNQYQAVVTNAGGSITSTAATLTISGVATSITTRLPAQQTANVGDTVTLTSAGSGLNLTISWASLQPGPGADYTTIAGATSPSYSFVVTPAMAGNTYYYKVTYANTQSSYFTDQSVCILSINANAVAPVVTAQPGQDPATAGGTAKLVTADTAYPVATVQWQVSKKAKGHKTSFADVPGLTGTAVSFPVTLADNGDLYRAVFTNTVGTTYSQPTRLAVNTKPQVINDVATLAEQAKAALASIATCAKVTIADGVLLDSDLRAAKAAKSQFSLVRQLETVDKSHRQTLAKNEAASLATMKHQAARVASDWSKLQKLPGNAVVQTDLNAALAALQSAADANTVSVDATRCHLGVAGSLEPITAAFPHDVKLQSDIAGATSESDNIGQILQAPMQTVLAIVADLKSDATA